MTRKASPIPEGYHSLTPYITFKNTAKAIEFYKKALGAKELFRMPTPDGGTAHAELRIGNSNLMMADEFPQMGNKSAESLGGSPVSLMVYVEDVDFVAKQATAAGMKTLREVQDQFYGDRSGTFQDPFGLCWTISTHVEDVSPEEMEKRAKAAFSDKNGCS